MLSDKNSDGRSGYSVAGFALITDVRQGFARPGSAGALFVLVTAAIKIEKTDRHTVLADRDSTGEIAILSEDAACIIGGQRLKFFDGDLGQETGAPYFYSHKNVGS